MPTSWLLEAQKAQAIAARTYALYEMGRSVNAEYKNVGADLCATDSCQVYAGVAKERRPGSGNWSAAVEATAHQVLVYRGGPIAAKYSSSNGGESVAGGQPYLRAGPDPDDVYSPLHQWEVTIPLADVVRIVGLSGEPLAMARDGDDVVAVVRSDAGPPGQQRVAAADFRSRLNNALAAPEGFPLTLPSVRFTTTLVDGGVRIEGRGWGHGIGLSQYGALGKAARGMKAADILAAYYGGLRPLTLSPAQVPDHVRVAVALGRAALSVGSPGRFRIVDGDGVVVAHSATGTWAARPAPDGRVELVPPADQAEAPTAALASIEPVAPEPGDAVEAKLELDGPQAVTRIVLVDPEGAVRELDPPRLRRSGPVRLRLGPATTSRPGTYRIDVERDAGAGRSATSTLTVDVTDPAAVPAPRLSDGAAQAANRSPVGDGDADRTVAALGAVLALLAVAAATLRVGRRRVAELH